MLTLDLLEGGGGARVVAVLQLIQCGIVEVVDRPLDISLVFEAIAGASAEKQSERNRARMPETHSKSRQSSAPFGPAQTSKLKG